MYQSQLSLLLLQALLLAYPALLYAAHRELAIK
jgi:hypothetical protein